MDLFEKVEEFKELNKKIKELHGEISEFILVKFVNLRYQIEQVQVGYKGYENEQREKIKIYYPILDLPEGFSKQDDIFFRKSANEIRHSYTLTDSVGKQIKVEEFSCFTNNIYMTEKFTAMTKTNIVFKLITYKIYISEAVYEVKRIFTYEEMLKKIAGNKEITVTCKDTGENYSLVENLYEKYLKDLGKTGHIMPLKELFEFPQSEMQITPTMFAKFDIRKEKCNKILWFEGPIVDVRINQASYLRNIVEVKIYTKDNKHLNTKRFEYLTLEDKDKFVGEVELQKLLKQYS